MAEQSMTEIPDTKRSHDARRVRDGARPPGDALEIAR
jgi:hypothetical protein